MHDEVGQRGLLERRLERLDQLVRKLADEPDRVGQQVAPAVVPVGAGRRVERVEEPLPHPGPGARHRVQERRLAGIRVAGERDDRERRAAAARPHDLAVSLDALEAAPQVRDPVARQAAVGLDLGLAGAPACRSRLRAARGGSTGPASARGCTRAVPARPGAFPRRCAAWSAKMSRITAVRSITGTPRCRSRFRSCRGTSSSSQATRFAFERAISAFDLGELATADVAVGVRSRAHLDDLAHVRDARCAEELLQLRQGIAVAGRGGQDAHGTVRAGGRGGSGSRWRRWRSSTPNHRWLPLSPV